MLSEPSAGPDTNSRIIPGRTLADAIADYHRAPSTLGLHDLLRHFTAACYALARTHHRGSVHLGLNPRLIVVGEFNEISVGGCGPDRPAEPDAYAMAFLAPEQIGYQPEAPARDIGPSADVYSLGAILYAMLTGQPPYTGATSAEVIDRVREGLPWQPRMVAGGIPSALEAVCLTAMERDPADRYSSAVELARDIERWMAGQPLRTNYVETKGERLSRLLRSRYGLLALVGLLLASLMALGVALYVARIEHQAAEGSRQQTEQAKESIKELIAKLIEADLAAAQDCITLGQMFHALGRLKDARQKYERAVQLTQAVHKADPENGLAKKELVRAALGLSQVQLALHEPTQARQTARLALDAADPNDAADRREVARGYQIIAAASEVLHDWPAARTACDKRLTTVETWAKADSPSVQDRLELANAWIDRGAVEQRDHFFAEALKRYDRAVAVLNPLEAGGQLKSHPQDLARLQSVKKNADDCRAIIKSIDDLNGALQETPETVLRVLVGRAGALARLGRPGDAAATAEKLRELKPQDGTNLYNIACCYALCIPAVGRGKPVEALSPEEKAARAGYAAQAVKDLRAAFDHGFTNMELLESDPDLDVLRAEAGYRSLIAELKALRQWITFPVLP